jgi:hypothetical protein
VQSVPNVRMGTWIYFCGIKRPRSNKATSIIVSHFQINKLGYPIHELQIIDILSIIYLHVKFDILGIIGYIAAKKCIFKLSFNG